MLLKSQSPLRWCFVSGFCWGFFYLGHTNAYYPIKQRTAIKNGNRSLGIVGLYISISLLFMEKKNIFSLAGSKMMSNECKVSQTQNHSSLVSTALTQTHKPFSAHSTHGKSLMGSIYDPMEASFSWIDVLDMWAKCNVISFWSSSSS